MLHDCICALAPNRASEKAGQAKDAAKDAVKDSAEPCKHCK